MRCRTLLAPLPCVAPQPVRTLVSGGSWDITHFQWTPSGEVSFAIVGSTLVVSHGGGIDVVGDVPW